MIRHSKTPVVSWLAAGAILILLMVAVGGITRLTKSGLSMAHWSLSGSLPPVSDEQWALHFEAYKVTPEYRLINHSFQLDDFKKIFWWEYIHRALGRLIGFVFIIPFLFFLFTGRLKGRLLRDVLILLIIGSLQGALGWFMVKSGLIDKPHVDHFRLAAHLFTALLAFGWCIWIITGLVQKDVHPDKPLSGLSFILLCLVSVQIVYGGFVSGLKAGYIFNSFPLMNGSLMASDVTRLDPVWMNFLMNGAGVQFIHRWVAVMIVLIVFTLLYYAGKRSARCMNTVYILVSLVFLQFSLGVITLIFQVPLVAAVVHQVVAFLLLGSVVILFRQVKA